MLKSIGAPVSSPPPPAPALTGASSYLSAVQSIPSNAYTPFAPNVNAFDVGGYWNAGTPERFTVIEAGCYIVGATIRWNTAATDFQMVFRMNTGSTDYAGARVTSDGSSNVIQSSSVMLQLSAGDYVTCSLLQFSGSPVNVLTGQTSIFWIAKIS